MRILLTNDDGVESEGILSLRDALVDSGHKVWVIAPTRNRSGVAQNITLRDDIRVFKKKEEGVFACDGTPTDCVLLAVTEIVEEPIDLVISGINRGPNLGTDIIYSGTAAGAREGSLKGIPSVGASLEGYAPPYDFGDSVRYLVNRLAFFTDNWREGMFYNVNFPRKMNGKSVLTYPCKRAYEDSFNTEKVSESEVVYTMCLDVDESSPEGGSDLDAISRGLVSITPLKAYPAIEPFDHLSEIIMDADGETG